MTVEFTLDKIDFVALNGGPPFRFTEAISFSVNCETQDEIDFLGETFRRRWIDQAVRLAQGQIRSLVAGHAGLSRRHISLSRPPRKANRVVKALVETDKIDIAALEKTARTSGCTTAFVLGHSFARERAPPSLRQRRAKEVYPLDYAERTFRLR